MPNSNGQGENFVQAVSEVSERMSVLVRDEIELAKTEVTLKAKSLGRGAAAVGAGAVFGVFAVIFMLLTIAWGLNSLLSSIWLGFLIVFVLLLVLSIIAFLVARRLFRVGPPAPTMAIEEAKLIRETVNAKTEGQP